jgi:DNA-binding response OmpR family regulator
MAVLTKPFPMETMAARIRAMIEAGKEHESPALRKF